MFSLFKAHPPLAIDTRVNLELLMRRTIEAIGPEHPRSVEFASRVDDLPLDLTRLLNSAADEVRRRLPPMPSAVEISIDSQIRHDLPAAYREATASRAAVLQIHPGVLDDPLRTVVELANLFSMHYWHCSGLLPNDAIHANLTQLLPICCGLGGLVAEASLSDSQWSAGAWQGWAISRTGYYNPVEIGYALALWARHRREPNPSWLPSVRLDARATVRKASRYFLACDRQRKSLLFDARRIPGTTCSPAELAGWFSGDDDEFALAAGYALCKIRSQSPLVMDAAIATAQQGRGAIVPVALDLIGAVAQPHAQAEATVQLLIRSPNPQHSIAALVAAHSLGLSLTLQRRRISKLLDSFAEGSDRLIDLVAAYGPEFELLDQVICEHLAESIRYSNDSASRRLAACLCSISQDPGKVIESTIQDADIKQAALGMCG